MCRNLRVPIDGSEFELLCPQCGDNHLHISKVSVHRGEDKVTVTGNKVSVDLEKNPCRGTLITIKYEGECAHRGEITFVFHKGTTLVSHKALEDIPTVNGMYTTEFPGDI